MRKDEMITLGKCSSSDLLSYSLDLFFKKMYGDQYGEFICEYCTAS